MLPTGIQNIEPINKIFHDSWSVISLKPLPPLRPTLELGKNVKNKYRLSPSKSVESNYEEDIQILRVIEAYCSSNRLRVGSSVEKSSNEKQTVEKSFLNKENFGKNEAFLLQERYIMDSIDFLGIQLSDLSQKVNIISRKLDKEVETRIILQNSIKSTFSKLGYRVD